MWTIRFSRSVKTGRLRFAARVFVFASLVLAGMLAAGPSGAQFGPVLPIPPPVYQERLPGTLRILNWYLSSFYDTQFRIVWGGISVFDVEHRLCDSYGDHCTGWINFGRVTQIRFPNGNFAVNRGGRWQSQVRPAVPNSIVQTINYNTMPPDARPSGAPERLSVSLGLTAAGNRTAKLFWRHAHGATHYQVRVCTATRNGAGVYTKGRCNLRGGGRDAEGWLPAQRASGDAEIQRYKVAPLFSGSHYYLQVRGTNGHGTGPLAEIAISTPPVTPLAPTGLSLSSVSNTSATVAWRSVSGASGYQARTCAATRSGSSYTRGACGSWTSKLTATSHTFTGLSLTSTSRVFVQVRAVNPETGAAPGVPSQLLIFLRVPDAPPSVYVSEVTPTTAILAWGAATRASRYQVRTCAATRSGNSYTRGACDSWTSDLTASSHTFTGLSQTTSYMLQVRGSNASGVGPASEVGIQTYNNRCGAAGICVTSRQHHTLTVEWDPSSHGELVWMCRYRGAGSQCRPGYEHHAYALPARGTYSHTFRNLRHDTEYTFGVGYLQPTRYRWAWIARYRYWRTFTTRASTTAYRLPTANAGADKTATEGQEVTLSGSGTLSPDRPGQTLRYSWRQTAGPTVTLSSATAQNPTFNAPVQLAANTTLTFSLVVNDGLVYSQADAMDVVVTAGQNDAPTASAGADQRVAEGVTVTLDASASTDPENVALTYAWTQTSGQTVTLSSTTARNPTFDAPAVTADATLEFSLTVTDQGGLTSTDTVSVTVLDGENTAPTADAGDPLTAAEGAEVTLDGSGSSDPESHVLRYVWTQTGGPTVTLSDAAAETPAFTAPQVVAEDNVLTFSLTVNDYLQDSEADAVTVTVTAGENDAPTASAGADLTVDEGAAAALDGSGSDPENRELFYTWTQTAGPTVALSSATTAAPTFVAPDVSGNATLTFSLTVNDGVQDSSADTVNVTVRGDANAAPTANAGTDQTVAEEAAVTLDGSASSDPESGALTYVWTQTAGTPTVALGSATSATPTFTAPDVPADTELVFSLTVVDVHGTSSPPDEVTVTVTVANDAPTASAGTDQTVSQGAAVTLDGSGSSDPQNAALTYSWSQTGGTPAVTLSSSSVAGPTFTAPNVTADTVLTFSLTVNDGVSDSAADTVDITVTGDAPTADAGVDQTATEGEKVTLDGSGSSDPSNRPLSYSWTQTAGPTVNLTGTPSAPTFTAPDLKTAGTLTFSLTVTAVGTTSVSAADTVNVTVNADDDAPTANAGADQTVDERVTVTLDGSASTDPENGALTYSWSQTGGSPTVTLSSATAAKPTFTAPSLTANATLTFSLTVNDGVSDSVADTVTVRVNNLPSIRVTARTATSVTVEWDRQGGSYRAKLCYRANGGPFNGLTLCPLHHTSGYMTNRGSHTFTNLNRSVGSHHTAGHWQLRILFSNSELHIWSSIDTTPVTVKPTANAGADRTVAEGTAVTLDGSGSVDPKSGGLTYSWSQTGGTPAVTLSSATAASPTFTAPQVLADSSLTFSLTVTDSASTASSPDTVTVTVRAGINDPPTANAGADLTAAEGTWVRLDGGGSDPERQSLTYSWTPPQGVRLTSNSARRPAFVAPNLATGGTLVFSLTVNDGVQDSVLADTVAVTVSADNDPPTAKAGADLTVAEGRTATLDGSGSSDPENRALTYSWSQTAGPTATLSSPRVASPTFTAPELLRDTALTFSLTVIDAGGLASQPVRQVVTVTADDDPPTADAGDSQTVDEGAAVTLDGSASADPEGETLIYSWSQTGGAPTVTLGSASTASPTFTAPALSERAVLTFSLTVDDGRTDATDTVEVTVEPLAGVSVSATSLTVAEGGAASYTVVLDSRPASGSVVEVDVSSDSDEVTVSADAGVTRESSVALAFDSSNWNRPRTVTVSASEDNDSVDDGATLTQSVDATATTDGDYDSVAVSDVTVTVRDNDSAGVSVSATSLQMTEGGEASYTLALTAAPALGSFVEVDVSSDNGEVEVSTDGGATKAASAALTFGTSNWNHPQTVTVSAAEDSDTVADSATLTQSVDATATTDDNFDSVAVENVSVSVADNDVPNIDVSRSAALGLVEGSSFGYDVRLAYRPAGDVVVRVSSGGAAVTVNKTGATAGTRQDLTFTADNWNRGQAVTLAAVEDDDTADPAAVTITHGVHSSADAGYSNAADVTFTVNVTDDDVASMVVGRSAAVELAEGSSFGYDVRLAYRPAGDVVVRVSSGGAAVTVNKAAGTPGTSQDLTFTADNWNRGQTVTLAAVEDDDTADPAAVTITHEIHMTADADYGNVADIAFTVNVTDDDVANMVVSRSAALGLVEGTSFGYDVKLVHRPMGDVVVRVSSGGAAVTVNKADGTAGTSQDLTFTADNWNRNQAVTLAAVEDDDAADPAAVTITHEVLAGQSSDDYDGVADITFDVTVTDDDVASMVVSRTAGLELAEGSSSGYDVKLAYRPTGDVVVRVSSGGAAVTVNKADGTAGTSQDLTFTADNWNRNQAVTLAAVEDDDSADPAAVTITHEVLDGMSSEDYENAVDVTFDVAVRDDDTPGVAVSKSSVNVNEEGSGADYTVVLVTEPSGDVTVTVASDNPDVKVKTGTGSASASVSLTFSPTGTNAWNTAQTVTVTADDDADSSDDSATLTQSVASGSASEYSSVNVADVAVNVADNDTPSLVVSRTTALALVEGGSSSYTVELATQPASDVVVEISSDNEDVKVKTGTDPAATSIRLTFTNQTWSDAQSVTVEAGSDDDSLDDSATITHSVAGESSYDEYDGVSDETFAVSVTDSTLAGLSIADAEASESAGRLDFTVTLSMASSRTVTVDWTLSTGTANPAEEGTATSGDYDATAASATTGSYDSGTKTGTLTFSSRQSLAQTISVPINDDFAVEEDETVTVTLSGASGASVSVASATGTIRNDDAAGVRVSPERSLRTTTEDAAGTVDLTIALSSRPSADVTVTVTSSDTTEGTVKASEDDPDPTLDFTPADWSEAQSVTVTGVDDDDLDEDVEYNVRLVFSDAPGDGEDTDYTDLEPVNVAFTNLDDDLAVFSLSGGGEVEEGDPGTTSLVEFTVTLAPAKGHEVSVSYATSDGTAEAGSDYESAAGTVTFSDGETSKTISVTVNGDDEAEGNETFSLGLTSSPNGQIDPQNSTAQAVITNDDEKTVDAGMSGEFSVGDTEVTVDSTLPADTGLEVVLPSELESGGSTIEELTVTLGPSDQEIDSERFGYSGADPDHVLVDIEVSPIPDATVRICLPVTEGLRRAAGEQRLYMIRFSNGQWEELSSETEREMVCADVRGFSPFALVFQIDYAKRRVGEVNRAILPELARAMTASTLDAITSRIDDAVSGGARGNSLNVRSPSQDPAHLGPGLRLGEFEDGETLSLLDAVDDSYFSVSLAGGYDSPRADTEAAEEAVEAAPRTGGLGVWVSGDYRNLSGRGGGLADWDGSLIAGHLGADYRFGRSFLAGVATSWSQGSFDYSGRGEEGRVAGRYESRMNSFHPYVGLSLSGRLSAWASAGWGFGEIRMDDGEIPGRQRAAARMGTLATGTNLRLLGDGATELSLRGEAWISRAEIKGNGDRVEGLRVKTNRLRAALKGSHALAFGRDSSLVPSLEFGVRRDGGDGETGVGGELGGGINLTSSLGLSLAARGRMLLFHQGDSKEWGVAGSLAFDRGGDGRGLSVNVVPSYGDGSSGLDRLWDGENFSDQGASVSRRTLGIETEVGYGFPAFGDSGSFTPYGGFGRPNPDGRTYRFGSRISAGGSFDLTIEGRRGELRSEDPEHELTLQGRLNW